MRYFEENMLDGEELRRLHNALADAYNPLACNLFFHQVEDEADTPKHRETLARSAYNVIGVCEAILERVPEDERKSALDEVTEQFKPIDYDELDSALDTVLKAIFG